MSVYVTLRVSADPAAFEAQAAADRAGSSGSWASPMDTG